MSGFISKFYTASILLSALAIFGCSSSSDSGGGTPTATVPAGAITITDTNATGVVSAAILTGTALLDIVDIATAIEVDQALTARDIINLAVDKAKNTDSTSIVSTPTGVVVPINETCDGGGTVTGSSDETATSSVGTVNFNACTELGITLNGTVSFNFTENISTGDYTNILNGNISGSDGVDTVTLNGLSFNESGNNSSGNYSLNTYTFSADFTGGGGFLVQLLAAVVGNDFQSCPDSGIILVTGANNTQAKGTVVANSPVNDVKIEFNDGSGTFVEVAGSPFPCTSVFI